MVGSCWPAAQEVARPCVSRSGLGSQATFLPKARLSVVQKGWKHCFELQALNLVANSSGGVLGLPHRPPNRRRHIYTYNNGRAAPPLSPHTYLLRTTLFVVPFYSLWSFHRHILETSIAASVRYRSGRRQHLAREHQYEYDKT